MRHRNEQFSAETGLAATRAARLEIKLVPAREPFGHYLGSEEADGSDGPDMTPSDIPTPSFIRLTRVVLASAPEVYVEPSVAPYADKLSVDTGLISETLVAHGQSERLSRALRIAFLDGRRIAASMNLPPGLGVGAWVEPLGVRRRIAQDLSMGYREFPNFIGVPLIGHEDTTDEGVAELNARIRHEIGHLATSAVPIRRNLYERNEAGEFLPYWYKTVFGVIPVPLGVAYLKARGSSEFEALWKLDKNERRAIAFEKANPNLSPISVRS